MKDNKNNTVVSPVTAQSGSVLGGSQLPGSPNQLAKTSEPKLSATRYFWRYLFILLGVLQAASVVGIFLMTSSVGQGEPADILVGIVFIMTLAPFIGVLTLVNLIGLPIYVGVRKPEGAGLVFSTLSWLISLGVVIYWAYILFIAIGP